MTDVNVGPNEIKPTHVFSLSDGTTTKGFITCDRMGRKSIVDGWRQSPMPRTAMKLSQGAARYEDFELPFTSIIQENFEGGMNAEDFENDRTKYRDGRHCDTTRGDVICGPKVTSKELISTVGDLTYTTRGYSVTSTLTKAACSFTPSANITVTGIKGDIDGGTKLNSAYAAIYSDSGDAPDTLLGSGSISVSEIGAYTISLNAAVALTSGTKYWISWYFLYGTGASNIGWTKRAETGETIRKYNGSDWTTITADANQTIAFELIVSEIGVKTTFFEHRRNLYAVISYDSAGTAPVLYANGYRGVCSSANANLSIINTNANLSVDPDGVALDLSGKILLLIEGPGSLEERPWRTITANGKTGTNDTITVGEPWKIQPTTDTQWVVLGSDDWWLLTGHGLTGKVTDVQTVYDYIALAQGSAINMRKMRWTSAGYSYAADGTSKADLLLMVADTEGNMNLWRALVKSNYVDYAPAQEYATDHTFGDNIKIGVSKYDDIRNLVAYGDPLIPYVIKENSFGSIQNDIYAEIPLGELDEVRSMYNGIAAMKHGVYLYFNIEEMIERFYDRRLDDVGPTRGEGLPEARKGIVRKLLSYPGRYYALLQSSGKVPSILCNNGIGWHEIWRPTNVTADGTTPTGEDVPFAFNVSDSATGPCDDMIIQVIPGPTPDRLWFDHAGTLNYIPVAINPRKDSQYTYRDLSQFETAWIYGNLKDVNKYWHSIKLHTENLSGVAQSIKIEYMVDEDTTWTKVGVAETSPIQELDLSTSYNVTGYRIKFRFTLHTSSATETPRIIAIVVKGVIRIDVKKGWNVTVISENERDLNGDVDDNGNLLTQLDTWANSDSTAAPLVLRHNISYYDNKYVFIDPASVALQQVKLAGTRGSTDRIYKEILSFTMYEV